jgi:hypothetical protein
MSRLGKSLPTGLGKYFATAFFVFCNSFFFLSFVCWEWCNNDATVVALHYSTAWYHVRYSPASSAHEFTLRNWNASQQLVSVASVASKELRAIRAENPGRELVDFSARRGRGRWDVGGAQPDKLAESHEALPAHPGRVCQNEKHGAERLKSFITAIREWSSF